MVFLVPQITTPDDYKYEVTSEDDYQDDEVYYFITLLCKLAR